jgi:alcohol dehydrogenase class IV
VAVGIDDSRAAEIARAALKDPTAPTNPVALDEASLAALFRAAL